MGRVKITPPSSPLRQQGIVNAARVPSVPSSGMGPHILEALLRGVPERPPPRSILALLLEIKTAGANEPLRLTRRPCNRQPP